MDAPHLFDFLLFVTWLDVVSAERVAGQREPSTADEMAIDKGLGNCGGKMMNGNVETKYTSFYWSFS